MKEKEEEPTPLVSTIAELLKDRELPPKGRATNFDAEFKRRFGYSPTEAHEKRKQQAEAADAKKGFKP